ncbi:stage II sporulation protein M [Brevibacillus sp. SYP-B805]|uniref:stage II sporulation protein M n=1 Tax=Brevibacillus sp. SYP-B805 TaxID=1578199 RepID=UPI0013EDE54F|nr:stage II sporulation protein M [Brevibacillus sp. SYP-B805]NGQ94662.1 stage II sporulation protein M [Brevibacillus sp. SYP-B805]
MKRRVRHTLQAYMQEHQSLYLFAVVLFAMGVIFGAVIVNALDLSQKQELIGFLHYFFANMDENGIADPGLHFQQTFGYHLKTIGVMWILGLSIIGLPLILLLLFLKGVIVGFTVGFLVDQLQWQGVTFSLVGVLPQNMLIVPALLIVGVGGISFSLRLIRTRLLSKRDVILPYFISYTGLVFAMLAVLTIAALFETYVSPALMQYVIN